MLVNAFIGRSRQPSEADLAAALGAAKVAWDQFVDELAERLGVTGREWKSYSPKAGWSVRLTHKKRTIVWLAPGDGAFQLAFILGDRALAAARSARLPKRLVKALDGATRYPEGTGVRVEIRKASDLAGITRLAEIKLAN